MGLFKDEPPTPPNPVQVAGAQTSANVSTAVANAFLNNVNQVTPLGSLNYDQTSTYAFTDPSTGTTYNIPRFTATQTLSPQQQAIQDTNQQAEKNLSQLAAQQSGMLTNVLGQPFTGAGAPAAGDPGNLSGVGVPQSTFGSAGPIQTSLGNFGNQQSTFDNAGAITRDYGPADNFSADRSRVEEALYGRLNPQLDRERTNIEQRLADQGIHYGSPAYTAAMDDYNRQANDLRLGVTQTAGQEQQRLNDMAAQRAGFQNAAQQQAYQQAQGRGTFANEAQAQQYQEMLGAGTFGNTAQQNMFTQAAARGQFANAAQAQLLAQRQAEINAQNQARSQYLTEQYALRDQPINEVTALLSGSQVHQPTFQATPQGQIPTTDIAGLMNQNFSQNLANYQQQSTNVNSILGGFLGLGGNIARGPYSPSDRRIKENIHRMGTVFAADGESEGGGDRDSATRADRELPIYRYSFKGDPASTQHIGPMAQDVEKIDPGAVATGARSGVKYIDRGRVMGSILRAA